MACMGLRPDALRSVWNLNRDITFGASTLGRTREEMIATAVSAINRCHYWTNSHAEFLRMATGDHTLVKHLKSNPADAPLGPQDKVMIDFALRLTREPSAIHREDIDSLKGVGFSDEQAVDIVLITCVFNFMDRLADGLGVGLDPEMQRLVEKNADQG
jgi:uncharacterized peroxidase-related enzyme